MNRILLIIVFLFAGICTFAQSSQTETVYLSNGSVIKGCVVEQTKDQIKVKTLDGSIFVYEMSQVERIVKNQTESSEDKVLVQLQETSSSSRPFIKGVRFNGYFDMNLSYRSFYGGSIVGENPSFSLGVRIFDYGYVGLKSGIEFMEGFYNSKLQGFVLMIPFMVDIRGYYPINENLHPYMEFAFGKAWVLNNGSNYAGTGWRHDLGAGIDIKRLSLGLGWNAQGKMNRFYFKIGVKIGGRS